MKNKQITDIADVRKNDLTLKGFSIYEFDSNIKGIPVYERKDFYKICIHTGVSNIHYSDKTIGINGTTLFFGTPHIPYSWEIISSKYTGYSCLFTEDFLKNDTRSESLLNSPLFKIGGTPAFILNKEQKNYISTIFRKMLAEQDTSYIYKDELIRNYIYLIIHEAMKLHTTENYKKHQNASSRITTSFLELLERQFPIEAPSNPMKLKTAQDFADHLSVHVNHLNRAIKNITGKSTKDHIAERVISEAIALLMHTNWNISEIAFALGFEYPTYFNNFFKRITGITPKAIRKDGIV